MDVDAGDVDVFCCKRAHVYNLLHLKTEHRPADDDNEIKMSCFFAIRKELQMGRIADYPLSTVKIVLSSFKCCGVVIKAGAVTSQRQF